MSSLDFEELFKEDYPHKSKLRAIAHYKDKYLVSGDEDGRIVIWNFDDLPKPNPKKKLTLCKHERSFQEQKISFTDLGKIFTKKITEIFIFHNQVAASSIDKSFCMIDLDKKKVSYRLQCDFEINCAEIFFVVSESRQIWRFAIREHSPVEICRSLKSAITSLRLSERDDNSWNFESRQASQ